jgi:hypothetical protein
MNATLSGQTNFGTANDLSVDLSWTIQGEVQNATISKKEEGQDDSAYHVIHQTTEESGTFHDPLEPYKNYNYHVGGSLNDGTPIDSNVVFVQLKPTVTNTKKGRGK